YILSLISKVGRVKTILFAEPSGEGERFNYMVEKVKNMTGNNDITKDEIGILTEEGAIAFLASKWVEGIGEVYARRLVDRFGTDAVRILAEEPEKAESVEGLGKTRVETAAESLKNIPYPADLLAFLFSCGLSDMEIGKIFGKYRKRTRDVVMKDPYGMVEDVWRFTFFSADKIGRQLNIPKDDERRLKGALLTAVKRYAEDGHLFATPEQAIALAATIAKVEPEKVKAAVKPLVESGRLVESRGGLYLPVFYKAEKDGAAKLKELASTAVEYFPKERVPLVSEEGHEYSPAQLEALQMALNSPVSVLTGGPGSGKTTVLKGVMEAMEKEGKKVVVAAPTGRAAKRAANLTGADATTIHRLLGYRQGEGYHTKAIDADMLIIDEGSMMEQVLFDHLLQALRPGTRVILVGDVDQLPAIGAGDVLRDLIASGSVPVARLSENFRQGEGSMIAAGAKSINSGEVPLSAPDRDFMIVEEETVKGIHDRIISLMTEELPATHGMDPKEIQVVTPQQIGPLGARQLNIDLQARLNPEGPALRRGATIMRLGDPVMQTANSRERGVYNGEVGRIVKVNTEGQKLTVEFSDGNQSEYSRSELSELVLAYATTVHKLQGSEVKYMIFPVTMAHKPMLYRNLLYTGVSRATDLCVLVGEGEALRYAVGNSPDSTRNSNFKYRLRTES
ncbi:MAG: AAA family ATPase, partial [Muribaculaceae bacterium]|nr:AAA family ATPase [Muribaculaceae bacterium]